MVLLSLPQCQPILDRGTDMNTIEFIDIHGIYHQRVTGAGGGDGSGAHRHRPGAAVAARALRPVRPADRPVPPQVGREGDHAHRPRGLLGDDLPPGEPILHPLDLARTAEATRQSFHQLCFRI